MRQEEYEKLAELEERMSFFRAYHRRFADGFLRTLGPSPARILDAGCGTGGAIKALRAANPDWEVHGLDLSPIACLLARERTGAAVVEASVEAMPFSDGFFDGIVTADVVCQVDDPPRAMRELARCLRPGGVLLINVAAYRWLWSYHDVAVQNVRRFSRREVVALMRDAGFTVEYASYTNSFLLLPAIVRRKLFPPRRASSDVAPMPKPLEALFAGLSWLEFQWMRQGWIVPAGISVFAMGRKR